MSHQTGIKCNQQLAQFFAMAKDGRMRMIKVIINDREELALDAYREATHGRDWKQDYNDCVLPVCDHRAPCFIFYRLDERASGTGAFIWLFITWSPDYATVKQKMLYAATKSTLKLEFGAGQLKDELFGTVMEDISLEGYLKHLKSQLAPAPLTHREEELLMLRETENQIRHSVDAKHKTLQGVMFPLDAHAVDALNRFIRQQYDYISLAIDIKQERLTLDRALPRPVSVEQLQREVPADKGRFHLYRYVHTYEGQPCASLVFVYSMPGFVCSVKERMLYSSCKNELLGHLRAQAQLEFAKTFEVSEGAELTDEYLLEEIHPRKQSDGLKFEKPKGPSSRGPRRVTKGAAYPNAFEGTSDY